MTDETTALAIPGAPANPMDLLLSGDLSRAHSVGKFMKASGMAPQDLTPEACFMALMMANEMGLSPIMVLQNIFFVKGRPGWSSKFLIGLANRSGTFKGALQWDVKYEPDLIVRCWAIHAQTEERVEMVTSMQMAQAEGWTSNPKYRTMPELMLRYRAATFLVRMYCPEVLFGLPAADEIVDIAPAQATQGAMKSRKEAEAAAMGFTEAEVVEDSEVQP